MLLKLNYMLLHLTLLFPCMLFMGYVNIENISVLRNADSSRLIPGCRQIPTEHLLEGRPFVFANA